MGTKATSTEDWESITNPRATHLAEGGGTVTDEGTSSNWDSASVDFSNDLV